MDELTRITQIILLSILTGHNNVRTIRIDTKLSPTTVSNYLTLLANQGLVEVKTEDWKRGKHKPCYITNAGLKWLLDTSVSETSNVLLKIMIYLR